MPDRIEYGWTCIRLLWTESKVALVIDIDEMVQAGDDELERLELFPPGHEQPPETGDLDY